MKACIRPSPLGSIGYHNEMIDWSRASAGGPMLPQGSALLELLLLAVLPEDSENPYLRSPLG